MGKVARLSSRAGLEPRNSGPIGGSFHDFKLPNSGVCLPWCVIYLFSLPFFLPLFLLDLSPPTPPPLKGVVRPGVKVERRESLGLRVSSQGAPADLEENQTESPFRLRWQVGEPCSTRFPPNVFRIGAARPNLARFLDFGSRFLRNCRDGVRIAQGRGGTDPSARTCALQGCLAFSWPPSEL